MRGGARVLPGARCFRGAARRRFLSWAVWLFLAWAARAVFAVRRGGFWCGRRLFAQPFGGALAPLGSPPGFAAGFAPDFAAVIPRAGLCAGLLCRARARIINFSLI